MQNILSLRLRDGTPALKALVTGYLLALSLAYVYAFGNIFLVVGLTPKDIAIHYYGAAKKVQNTTTAAPTGEAELNLDEMPNEAATNETQVADRPSFKNLVAAGHFHLFGMSSFFFGLTLVALFTGLSERIKVVLVLTPFIAVIFDNLSFLATRFLGPSYAYLTALSGAFMGLSFLGLWCSIFYELYLSKARVES